MSKSIHELSPKRIWDHFYDLTRIPRPSGHEQKVVEHLRLFAERSGLQYKIDAAGNIIIRKEAYKGKETAEKLILQAHVDMVPQKNSDKVHDFLTDPIETVIDGEWVRADQTTLGADNGIGIATILTILESNEIKHGPLEAVFTVSEETGMDGASGLDINEIKGRTLLNLDSEDEGELFIGCAGGIDVNINWTYTKSSQNYHTCYKISLSGLKGGHSGIDIHLGRANANLALLEILDELSKEIRMQLLSFNGGNLRNAIPRESDAILCIDKNDTVHFEKQVEILAGNMRKKYKGIEENILLECKKVSSDLPGMSTNDQNTFIALLLNCPNGVIAMSKNIPGIVETSNNIAIVKAEQGRVEIRTLLRSSSDEGKMREGEAIRKLFMAKKMEVELSNGYPGWLPDPDSKILHIAKATYHKQFGIEPKVKVIHAGLECGIIGGKLPGLDMISFGPTIRHPHSPDEKVHIGSVGKFWKFLNALLEAFG
jgi:dipeptidase D